MVWNVIHLKWNNIMVISETIYNNVIVVCEVYLRVELQPQHISGASYWVEKAKTYFPSESTVFLLQVSNVYNIRQVYLLVTLCEWFVITNGNFNRKDWFPRPWRAMEKRLQQVIIWRTFCWNPWYDLCSHIYTIYIITSYYFYVIINLIFHLIFHLYIAYRL